MAVDAELDAEAGVFWLCSQQRSIMSALLQAQDLVKAALAFIEEVSAEADAAEGGVPEAAELTKQLQEVDSLRQKAEELSKNSGLQALKAGLTAVELLLFYTVKTEIAGKCAAGMYLTSRRQQVILARIGEVLWLAKDAVELGRDAQEFELEQGLRKTLGVWLSCAASDILQGSLAGRSGAEGRCF